MPVRAALLGSWAALAAGCFPCPQQRPLSSPDGGTIVCVRPTDCPVEAGMLTCTMTQDRLSECIGCESGQCVRSWPPLRLLTALLVGGAAFSPPRCVAASRFTLLSLRLRYESRSARYQALHRSPLK